MNATTSAGVRGSAKRSGASKTKQSISTFIIDTNVLLHDPKSIFKFEEHQVVIPVEVLEELDHIKTEQDTERGRNAREVTRELEKLFTSTKTMEEGIRLPGGGTVTIVIRPANAAAASAAAASVISDLTKKDNLIIRTALHIQETFEPPVVLVTKDVNMRLKARAVGLAADDYLNDRVDREEVTDAHGSVEINSNAMQRFASTGRLDFDDEANLTVNEYVLLRDQVTNKTMPARAVSANAVVKLNIPDTVTFPGSNGIRPRNIEQRFLLDALLDPEITLIAATGQAGTGKTLLATAAALAQTLGNSSRYTQIYIARPVMPLGKDIGFLPGSLEEKMRPLLQPYHDALEFLMPSKPPIDPKFAGKPVRGGKRNMESQAGSFGGQPACKPYERLLASGIVNISPITYIRGRSIPRSIFILDECQQLTPLEVKTIVTRMAEGSKAILLGDPHQIDNPYVDSQSNGLVHVMSKMRGEKFFAAIRLLKGERSKLAEAAALKL